MPKLASQLNDTQIKNLKPKDKDYAKGDGQGLQLLVKTNGKKIWEFIYKSPTTNKRRKTTFETYPTMSLANARKRRTEWIENIQGGTDPIDEKKNTKQADKLITSKKENTFKKVATKWLEANPNDVSENHIYKMTRVLELYTYPLIGNIPIDEITRLNIIEVLEAIKNKGIIETAHRTYTIINRVFKYAVTLELAPHTITADIDKKTILGKTKKAHYPTLTDEKEIGTLILAMEEYQGEYSTKQALRLLPYVFVRSFNLRHCEWNEINLDKQEWTIPASKMKTKEEFILPLSTQAVKILQETKKFYGWNVPYKLDTI